ncbi:hypothetical protein SLS56_006767 [Neofusicoccum ribis]|uniref:AA1-like domain-containing protein n=1 Tax=Neofusicoccum ribis TaxID=45134 RepID=A0ABR3SQK6_9PEZI
MRFFTIAAPAFLGALATASEVVQIKDLSIRDNNGIQATSFTIQPANVQCSATTASALANKSVVICGESKYRFAIDGANSKYSLTLYKETAPGAGITGTIEVQPYCHAGGNGANDFVCTQVSDISVAIY